MAVRAAVQQIAQEHRNRETGDVHPTAPLS
jgi:hypothetical protein